MKYKLLVMGKSNSIIDDFFIHMDDAFEVISTSTRYKDVIKHLKYYAPDALVYCLYNESQDSLKQMLSIKPLLQQSRTPVIVLGAKEDCDEFDKIALNVASLTLTKPFTASSLKDKIMNYMEERKPYVEAYKDKMNTASANAQREALYGGNPEARDMSSIDVNSLKTALSSLEAALSPTEEALPKVTAPKPVTPPPAAAPAQDERKCILVVDDAPIMLKTVKEQLHNDYDVATAISGKIAMKFLERKRADLILLDYEMPEENGVDVLKKIRENDAIRDIPVVFLTGVSDREKIKEVIGLKPQGYLLKPIDHDKLMETISNFVR